MNVLPLWDLLLRGAVGGVLLVHLAWLQGSGPRAATRVALSLFTLALIAYLFCQKPALLKALPSPLIWLALALCTSATAWLWLAARALFDDQFHWNALTLGAGAGLMALGLAAHAGRMHQWLASGADPGPGSLDTVHALAMAGFTTAAVWEVLRGWRDDLVAPRRAARRWAALAIGLYAAVALAVELAVRDRPVGPVLPALHVAGIGAIALALARAVARGSLEALLGAALGPPPGADEAVAATPPSPPGPPGHLSVPGTTSPTGARGLVRSEARTRLDDAMTARHLYRQEGLTVATLAAELGLGEAALRTLINQELGFRNFNDFLHHHRLREAAGRLAAEDLPVLTIALECGYGSIGPFNRAFRHRFGMTPTAWRAASRLAPPPAGG